MSDKYLDELHFVIPGIPMSKSNNSIYNPAGGKILSPEYLGYERNIATIVSHAAKGKVFQYKVITYAKVFFKSSGRHVDLNNMPKSICDGIEKSGIIQNDIDINTIYFEEYVDADNPRVEISIYSCLKYSPVLSLEIKSSAEQEDIYREYISVNKKRTKNRNASEKRKLKAREITSNDKKIEVIQNKKNKAIQKSEKKNNRKITYNTCSICNKEYDTSLLSKISNSSDMICRACILCGYGG